LIQSAIGWIRRLPWSDHDISAEGAEFGGQAALCIDLQIEQSGGDGGARA
jgi:hypothetical protein